MEGALFFMPGNVYVYRESESTDAECAPARPKVRKNIDSPPRRNWPAFAAR